MAEARLLQIEHLNKKMGKTKGGVCRDNESHEVARSRGHGVETAVFFADKNAADDKVAAEELAAEFTTTGRTPSTLSRRV